MSKFREAMKAGQLAYGDPGNKSLVPFYCTLAAVLTVGLIKLGYAYAHRSVISAIASVIIWWVITPIFSWFWFRGRQARKNLKKRNDLTV
jgi:hypothetical protein